MSQTLMEGVEVNLAVRKSGILDTALPAPQG